MSLSSELISQFAKITKDDTETKKESTVYGTTVKVGGKTYVKLDGSDLLTPVSETVDSKDNERVEVTIKNHTATVTGNISSPSARTDDVKESASHITDLEIATAYRITTEELNAVTAYITNLKTIIGKFENVSTEDLTAVNAQIESLETKFADIQYITAEDVRTVKATIESLEANIATFKNVSTEDLEAANAEIGQLKAYNAKFTYIFADELSAINVSIQNLEVNKLSAREADIKYVNIDFANIDKAWMEEFYSRSGIIEYIEGADGTFSGTLVGVTIKGDLIEGNTIKADKIVVKSDTDGLYYKLNFEGGSFTDAEEVPTDGIHGSVIVAKSITAEKVNVNDLVAFGATIGGFEISDTSINSVGKESIDSSIEGSFFGADGQISIGNGTSYLRFVKKDYRKVIPEEVEVCYLVEPIFDYGEGNLEILIGFRPTSDVIEINQDEETWVDGEVDNGEIVYGGITTSGRSVSFLKKTETVYTITDTILEPIQGDPLDPPTFTPTGEQVFLGSYDGEEFIYFIGDGEYKLEISADSILFGATDRSAIDDIKKLTEHVKIGTWTDPKTGDTNPSIELAEGDSDFKQIITNKASTIKDGDNVITEMNPEGIDTQNLTVRGEVRQKPQGASGAWAWVTHGNGNIGLMWKEEVTS